MHDHGIPPDRMSQHIGSTDNHMIRRAQANEQESWQELLELYTPLVYRFLRKKGLQPADASDLTQTVLIEVTRSLPKFSMKNRGAFRKWLKVITTNKITDFYRKQEKIASLGEVQATIKKNQVVKDEMSAENFEPINERQVKMRAILKQAQNQVSEQAWQAFQMMNSETATSEEIGRQLNMSAPAVRMAKKRVLAQFRILWESSQQNAGEYNPE